jgi:hypothetical protein
MTPSTEQGVHIINAPTRAGISSHDLAIIVLGRTARLFPRFDRLRDALGEGVGAEWAAEVKRACLRIGDDAVERGFDIRSRNALFCRLLEQQRTLLDFSPQRFGRK